MGKRKDSGRGVVGPRRAVLGALLGALAAALFLSAPALALTQRGHTPAFSIGSYGSGAGNVNVPLGVAVSEASGDVYVVDSRNNRVDRFEANGKFIEAWGWGVKEGAKAFEKCTTSCKTGLAGSKPGELEEPEAIAVDNSTSASDPSRGDVYVEVNTTEEQAAIDKFSPNGELLDEITGVKPEKKASFEAFEEIHGLTVDRNGDLLVSDAEEVFRFDDSVKNVYLSLTGSEELEGESAPGIAADSSGNLYLAHKPSAFGSPTLIGEIDGEGKPLTQELSGESASAVAVDPSTNPSDPSAGDVFVDNLNVVTVFNAAGSAVERFGASEANGVAPLIMGSGVAVNSSTGMVYVADEVNDVINAYELEPAGKPQIDAVEQAQKATSTSATLGAQIDPTGSATTYVFRYQAGSPVPGAGTPCTAPCVEAPSGEGSLGEGFGDQSASAPIQGLQPATRYHFIVIAKNANGEVASTEESFSTEPAESTFQLPDGRQWQLVSPQEKSDASLQAITKEGGVIEASESGDALTYLSTGPLQETQGNRGPEFSQILSKARPRGLDLERHRAAERKG